jgi:hypothetical protein
MWPRWITLNRTRNVVPCSSNLTKQGRSFLLGLVGFVYFCPSVTVIRDQNIPENVSTAVHLFAFPGPGEAFSPHLRSVLLHSSAVLHANWNPVRQGRLVLSCGGQAMYLWSEEWIGEGGAEKEMAECVAVPASACNVNIILIV